ncbi:MAG TPA: LmeA family phospholipid-binding protein [Solirubrobacteraceae bacterium]|nr:LmeA family phospholipid-binding protein [Solirubrobacteraceae bacterium]
MRRLIAVAIVLAALVVLAAAAQLVLPGIAENRIRDRLAHDGRVESVQVSAFPAVKLLWGKADRVTVRMASVRAAVGRLGDLIGRTADAGRVDASTRELDVLTLRLRDANLRKRGNRLVGEATVTDADLRAALPPGFAVRPVASANGQLVLRGTVTLFGATISANAVLLAQDGRLRIAPDVPFGGFAALTVFSDSHVHVDGVGARAAPGGGFILTAYGRLTG